MKKHIGFIAVIFCIISLAFIGCTKDDSGKIVLKMGDCHPDREGGVGSVLERINAEFIEVYPNVEFEIESFQDQPWQQKVRQYANSNQLPDVFKWWTFPNMMGRFINAGYLESFNKDEFAQFNYLPGSLESCEYDGNLYGIPASGDMWVLYVNKELFEKAGISLPETWEDVIAAVPAFRDMDITPLVTNGLEGWPLCIFFDGIAQRINGDFTRNYNAIDRKNGVKFTDPDFVQAAAFIQRLVAAGVFNSNLTTADYGNAQNQFIQGRAAIYMMGSWEMGMATNASFDQSFRDSLDVIKFPVIQGGLGTTDEAMVWFGGNFVVSANSANKEIAVDYIKFLAERFGVYCWETGAGFPAQVVSPRDEDSDVSKKLLQFSAEATTISGKGPGLDYGKTNVFKEEFQELVRQLCTQNPRITPEEFCASLDAAAELDSKE